MSKGRIFLITASAMTLFLALGMAAFLYGQEIYVPDNGVSRLDEERSQVFLSGEGYQIDSEQEKNHRKNEEKREDTLEKKEEKQPRTQPTTQPQTQPNTQQNNDPTRSASQKNRNGTKKDSKNNDSADSRDNNKENANGRGSNSGNNNGGSSTKKPTVRDDGGSRGGSNGENGNAEDPEDRRVTPSGDDRPEEERAKDPRIETSLIEGERVKGDIKTFWVTVTDYKSRNVPVDSNGEGFFTVTCNGEMVGSNGASGKKTSFRAYLSEGSNEIVIRAWDREQRKKVQTIRFTSAGEREPIGKVYVTIAAPILHLGTLGQAEVDLYEGDSAKDSLEAAFDACGITPHFSGSYLAGISRPGIAQGFSISDRAREALEELSQTEKDPSKQNPDSLKEHDFYELSGWLYYVNGEFPEGTGLNSFFMEDGDELLLVFSLYNGFTGIEELDGQSWED